MAFGAVRARSGRIQRGQRVRARNCKPAANRQLPVACAGYGRQRRHSVPRSHYPRFKRRTAYGQTHRKAHFQGGSRRRNQRAYPRLAVLRACRAVPVPYGSNVGNGCKPRHIRGASVLFNLRLYRRFIACGNAVIQLFRHGHTRNLQKNQNRPRSSLGTAYHHHKRPYRSRLLLRTCVAAYPQLYNIKCRAGGCFNATARALFKSPV